jgi:hypothetical protein
MKARGCRTRLVPILLGVLVVGTLLVGPQTAFAVDSGGTITGNVCMQRIFMGAGATVSGSNRLNCTANDISIAKALSATCSGTGCVDANTCEEGGTFDLNATFQVNVTANARYDAGFFFRIDGGSNARGDGNTASGICSLSWLDVPPPSGSPSLDLDGDTCGDLNAGTYTTIAFSIPGVSCTESTNNPGHVSLPNCTSWHSNQATACAPPPPAGNAFNFHPDTKSKCVCDDTFSIPIGIRKPGGSVDKTATQADVTYSVTITNTTSLALQITALKDDKVGGTGSITSVHDNIQSTGCSVPQNLAPAGDAGDSYTCSFVVRFANPGTGGDLLNTVTATLHRTIDGSNTTNDTDVTGTAKINVNLDVTGP